MQVAVASGTGPTFDSDRLASANRLAVLDQHVIEMNVKAKVPISVKDLDVIAPGVSAGISLGFRGRAWRLSAGFAIWPLKDECLAIIGGDDGGR
jgi:hypothetical protein